MCKVIDSTLGIINKNDIPYDEYDNTVNIVTADNDDIKVTHKTLREIIF